jgi:DNA polymerase III alpha subunit
LPGGESHTVIEWDKDDINALELLKVDNVRLLRM